MLGGRPRDTLVGSDQMLLSMIIFIYPQATVDQICAFIHANGGDIYTREQVINRCAELDISRKWRSKEALTHFQIQV